jgi:hypothetical protein
LNDRKISAAEAGFVYSDADVTPWDKSEENSRNAWNGNNVTGWILYCVNCLYVLKEFREKTLGKKPIVLKWRINSGSDDSDESYCLCIWNVRQISLAICLYDSFF